MTCTAAFMALHLTPKSNAYLEVSHLLPQLEALTLNIMQGTWLWLADHDLDGKDGQLSLFSGRGLLSESQGPVWMVGTGSEHHVIYQYNITNAADHYMGLIQTETVRHPPPPCHPVREN